MTVTVRKGVDGTSIAFGKQKAYGTPVWDRGPTPVVSNDPVMIPVLFPVSAITLDEDADVEQSNLITAYGAAPPVEIGQLFATGGLTTRILPEYFFHILEGVLVPATPVTKQLISDPTAIDKSTGGTPPIGSGATGSDQVNAPAGYPSRVKVSGVTGFAADQYAVIKGMRRAGRKIGTEDRLATFYQEEKIPLTAATAVGTKFWDEIFTFEESAGITAATYKWDTDTYETTMTFQLLDPQSEGYTALINKGGVPNRVTDWVMGELNVSANQSGIDVTIIGIGTRYDEYRTISSKATAEDPKYALEAADTAYYDSPSLKSFPGWAGALEFNGEIVKYASIDFGVNRNYQNAPGIDGRKFKYGVGATDNRLVTFSPTSYLRAGDATDTFLKFQEMFRNEVTAELRVINNSYDQTGRQKQVIWEAPAAQVSQSPRAEVNGPAEIERPVVFQAGQGSGNARELKVILYTATELYT